MRCPHRSAVRPATNARHTERGPRQLGPEVIFSIEVLWRHYRKHGVTEQLDTPRTFRRSTLTSSSSGSHLKTLCSVANFLPPSRGVPQGTEPGLQGSFCARRDWWQIRLATHPDQLSFAMLSVEHLPLGYTAGARDSWRSLASAVIEVWHHPVLSKGPMRALAR